jgi:single-stranded-DNA-specific exonuclease
MKTQLRQNGSVTKQWIDPQIYSITEEFQHTLGVNSLVSQILHRRGLNDVQKAKGFLDEKQYQPASPLDLPGLAESVDLLDSAIARRDKITVWGDFDVDGQTATALLVSTLGELGASVNYHIPVRANESHGINLPNLEKLLSQGTQLLLTCDTGITANAEIAYAQSMGVPVIVTDHHDPSPELPNAFAVINPKLLPNNHPLSNLPGVGVVYQLIDQLCALKERPEISQACLDLVALGIVADLALLQGDTRFLLQKGLNALRHTSRRGLQILCEMIEINPEHITEEHISFYIAPRLNALGRLSDANLSVDYLTTTDLGKARLIAVELEGLNTQRKLITDQVFQAAQAQIQSNPDLLENKIILLANPTWPAGVIGIVANRLVERYNLPTILLSTPPDQVARGSARSIEGINITEVIAAQKNHLISFGGHPMAAGLSMDTEKIPDFFRSISRMLKENDVMTKSQAMLQLDGNYSLSDLTLDFVDQIEQLAPFGPGNSPPVLATSNLSISGFTSVGRNGEHLILTVEDDTGYSQRVIWWQGAGYPVPQSKFDMAYTVRATTYRGSRDLQVEWIDYRTIENHAIAIQAPPVPIQIIDYRQETNPLPLLDPLLHDGGVQVWCEAITQQPLDCLNRNNLSAPCRTLVIWSIPPGPAEIHKVLEKTMPEQIYLFGVDPGLDQPDTFLRRLAGLVKYAIKVNQGTVKLSELAAASAHRIRTVQAGINWMHAHGHLTIVEQDGDKLIVQQANNSPLENTRHSAQLLKMLLDETAAFRSYYLKAGKNALINL